jgi:ABC-type transport system substrate-binding protein
MLRISRFHATGATAMIILALFVLLAAACGETPVAEEPVVEETIAPEGQTDTETQEADETETTDDSDETEATASDDDADTVIIDEGEETPTPGGEIETTSWETPHPILGNKDFRQGFAYCTDRQQLIASVYPFLDESAQEELLMDTFLPQGHWALADEDEITTYPYDPVAGIASLEAAGWTEVGPDGIRVNEDGERLSLKFTTTNAQFRITWATVLEQQLRADCGIEIVRTHAPGAWWFGAETGLQVRDFELGAYAWVGEADPGGTSLYACNQIPLPSNNWEGQNVMGWCNEEASRAIFAANNLLNREERVEQYTIVQREFTEDMVSLPLFNRLEGAAATNNLVNFEPNPTTDSNFANIDEWEMEDGGDTVVLGFTQEPASLWLNVESAAVASKAAALLMVRAATSYDYDYQPDALQELPTIENGGTTDEVIEVNEGDTVWTTGLEAVELAPGVEVVNADGEIVTYEGGPLEMRQLTVTFEFVEGLTWEDGVPVTAEDFELSYTIDCDPDSGAVSFTVCDSIADVEFPSDTSYIITYHPGVRWPEYFVSTLGTYSNLFSIGAYPAHRELSDGRVLADVPASEWSTLPEIAENPLSYGPYRLVEWQKGQRMIFEANPYYYKGEPPIKTVVVQFFDETTSAVAQLLTGEVDVLDTETLGAGPELERVLAEGEEGTIQAFPLTSPTWEHIDMNLFLP